MCPLHGDAEVDETLVGGRARKGAQKGRGTKHEALVVGAVEVRKSKAGRKYAGRVRLRAISNADKPTLTLFVRDCIAVGSFVRTDGWIAYDLAEFGYEHRSVSDREAGGPGRALPFIHREFSNLKTWLGGTHQGRVQRNHFQAYLNHFQAYLNEFAFRHNRRFWKSSRFQRLLQLALVTRAPSYRDIYDARGLGEECNPYSPSIIPLLEGEVDGVIRGLRWKGTHEKLTQKELEELERVCGYFENNRHRMAYDEYLEAGYPIASGVIEGACRNIIVDRMEHSGMRWEWEGAHAMLGMRCIKLSGVWDEFTRFRIKRECERLYPGYAANDGFAEQVA
jgi:hypothetical protein